MTRKEAIEELKAILEMQYWNVPLSKAALDMAIASLETDEAYQLEYERTTKNDLSSELEKNSQKLEKDFGELDCISREATINYFNNFRKKISSMPLMDVVDRLKEQPSVTPQEPKTGHWKDIPKYTDIAWECSECGRFTTLKHNYCPMWSKDG